MGAALSKVSTEDCMDIPLHDRYEGLGFGV